jgi:dTDP-4-dehydrorhamnose reductase
VERLKVGLIGKKSQLGKELIKVLDDEIVSFSSKDLDFCYPHMIKERLTPFKDSLKVIINCAAFNNVDRAETDPNSKLINGSSVKELAKFCKSENILLIHISTDNVFDGIKGNYVETDNENPINAYGRTKLLGEKYIKEYCKNYIILRTSWLFSKDGRNSFIKKIMDQVNSNSPKIYGVSDIFGSPTSALSLANAIKNILNNKKIYKIGEVFHFSNEGIVSRLEIINEILKITGMQEKVEVINVKNDYFKLSANRPQKANLISKKFSNFFNAPIPNWRDELLECLKN